MLKDSIQLSHKIKIVMRGGPQMIQFIKLMKKRMNRLQIGESMIIPGSDLYSNLVNFLLHMMYFALNIMNFLLNMMDSVLQMIYI